MISLTLTLLVLIPLHETMNPNSFPYVTPKINFLGFFTVLDLPTFMGSP